MTDDSVKLEISCLITEYGLATVLQAVAEHCELVMAELTKDAVAAEAKIIAPIRINSKGEIVDGRHRLLAAARSGAPIAVKIAE